MKLTDLKSAGYNPRTITEEQLKMLNKSLQKFGDLSGIVFNRRTGNTVGGHQRLKCLPPDAKIEKKDLKEKTRTGTVAQGFVIFDGDEKHTYREVDWDETTEKMANIAANKHGGDWDDDKLGELLKELSEIPGFDIDLIGFGTNELNNILSQIENSGLVDDDEIPDVPEKAKTKTGDLYILGEHRLLCGDATKIQDVEKLMNGKKATLGFTSPPYWVGKEYETQKSIAEIDQFIKYICKSYNFATQKDKSRIVINTSTGFTTSFDKKKKRQVLLLIDKWTNYFYDIGWNLRHIRHWIKEGQLISTAPKTDLIDQHCEFLGTFENDNGLNMKFDDVLNENDINILETFYNTSGITRGQERTGKKWALRAYWNDIRGNANQTNHCASFPVELPLRHIFLYTKKGEIVLDFFLGSGSTLIACEKTNRICYGMEIDPHYCDVIVPRYCKYTGVNKIIQNGKEIIWNAD